MRTDRHPNDRPGPEKRTPVQIDPDVYDEIRRLAAADERPISVYVNRVLRAHVVSRAFDAMTEPLDRAVARQLLREGLTPEAYTEAAASVDVELEDPDA